MEVSEVFWRSWGTCKSRDVEGKTGKCSVASVIKALPSILCRYLQVDSQEMSRRDIMVFVGIGILKLDSPRMKLNVNKTAASLSQGDTVCGSL